MYNHPPNTQLFDIKICLNFQIISKLLDVFNKQKIYKTPILSVSLFLYFCIKHIRISPATISDQSLAESWSSTLSSSAPSFSASAHREWENHGYYIQVHNSTPLHSNSLKYDWFIRSWAAEWQPWDSNVGRFIIFC